MEYTLDRSAVCCRGSTEIQATIHSHIHVYDKFRFANIPVISVDCGRKMEYLVKTHASMQKTQTLHEQHRAAIRPVTCCKKVQGSDSEELCEYSNEML